MINPVKTAIVAGLLLGASAQPVFAQAAPATTIIQGIAVANLEAVVANSNAFRTAQQQRPTTYKAQLDAAEARRKAIAGQIQPMIDKFNKDRAANVAQASLAQQAQAIQSIQESGQQELQRMLEPVALSEAYVSEQLEDKLDQAVKNAMTKKKVSILLNPQAILAVNNNAYNLNQDILNELNTMVPSAQLVPPQGWEPRQVREARAAQAAQQGQAAQPAGQAPQGR